MREVFVTETMWREKKNLKHKPENTGENATIPVWKNENCRGREEEPDSSRRESQGGAGGRAGRSSAVGGRGAGGGGGAKGRRRGTTCVNRPSDHRAAAADGPGPFLATWKAVGGFCKLR